jgi:hypothetical protein
VYRTWCASEETGGGDLLNEAQNVKKKQVGFVKRVLNIINRNLLFLSYHSLRLFSVAFNGRHHNGISFLYLW